MPIPLGSAPTDERIEALLQAQDSPPPPGMSGVAPCPLREPPVTDDERQPETKEPIRMSFWHLFELGGGFYMPHSRPQYAIDGCAELMRSLKLHVIVLQGLSRTTQEVPTPQGSGADARVTLETEPADTGVQEARRLLGKLQQVDAGAGWQMELPKARTDDGFLYHRHTTVAFLYASGKGISFRTIEIVEAIDDDSAGATGSLLAAHFDAPAHQSHPLVVMTSLGLATPERPWERLRVPAPSAEREPTATMPDSAVVFLSAPGSGSSGFAAFEDAIDAEFVLPVCEGSVLDDEFWKRVSEGFDGLLGNFSAMNLGNLLLQDREMHWEALIEPEHARVADKLPGVLAEGMALLHHRTTPPPKVQELRVVDLVAAALPAEAVDSLKARPLAKTADGSPPPELSVLVDQRKTYRAESVLGPEPEDDPANELSECGYFSRMLSRHWPLVVQLDLEPET